MKILTANFGEEAKKRLLDKGFQIEPYGRDNSLVQFPASLTLEKAPTDPFGYNIFNKNRERVGSVTDMCGYGMSDLYSIHLK